MSTNPVASGRSLEEPLLVAGTVAAAAVGLLAVRQPALTATGIVAIVVAVAALRSYTAAVALFTALTFFEGAPGFGGSVSVVKLLTIVLLISWILALAGDRPQPLLVREHPVVFVGILVLLAWVAASAIWAADAHAAESGAFRLLQMLLLVVLVFTAIRDRDDLWLFGWAFVAGAALTSLVALVGIGSGTEGSGVRFGGYLGNPNNLAAVVLPALALSGFMSMASSRRLERLLLAGCGVVLLLALVLTESRGGLVGLVAMMLAALVLAGPLRTRIVRLLVLLIVGGVGYYELVASSSARQRATAFSSSESTGRIDLWHVALRMFEAHPFQGVGLDNFVVLAPGYLDQDLPIQRADLFLKTTATQVHNTYLTILAELGAVGEIVFLALLVGIFVIAVHAVAHMTRARDRQAALLARGLVVGAVGMLTAYFFFSAQYEKQLWLVLGALLSLSTVARARA